MTRDVIKMKDDPARIKCLIWDDSDGSQMQVDSDGITEIVAYHENGQMAGVPWLALYRGDEILARVPSEQVMIRYFTKREEGHNF